MPQVGFLPRQSALIAGVVAPGAVLRFYQSGTSTPQAAYTDAALSNPVTSLTADAAGVFAKWYLNPNASADYRYTLETAAGSVYWSEDNISRLIGTQADIGAALFPRTSAEESAGVTPTNYAYEPGDLRRYGAVNNQDSTAAIQAAFAQMNAGGAEVRIPVGVFQCSASLTISYTGWRVTGEDGVRCIIQFIGAGTSAIVISALAGLMRGVGFYNTGTWDRALVLHNAGASRFYDVWVGGGSGGVYGFDSDGILIDDAYSGAGNNNNIRFINCVSAENGGCGWKWVRPGLDQNDIELYGCNSSANASHGVLLKGQANRIIGGIFEGNAGYGIQISEAGDTPVTSTRSVIMYPYLESNTLGGVRGGSLSLANVVYIDGLNANSSYTRAAGSEDFWVQPSNSSGPIMQMGDPACYLKIHAVTSGTPRLGISPDGTTTNLTMYVNGKGNGGTWLEADNDTTGALVKIGQQGSGLRNVLRGQTTFGANTTANVSFGVTLPNTLYTIQLGANANKTFWWASKTTTGFTLNASAVSSDTVDWTVVL